MGQTQHQKIYCQRTGNLTPRGQKISMIFEESRDIYIDTFRNLSIVIFLTILRN